MFGKMGDMMGKLQEMKQRSEEIKLKLDDTIIKAEGAGGDIKIEITGNREFKNITISGALQHGDKQELEEQLLIALNRAVREADKVNETAMKDAASGLIPGL
ncbi:nucleoid-associated protein, YbaB/EbfC family [Sphingobacteriaceae bacterium]|nr:nucleoid-associated protein, YbaB/EbfC family [Sphingobacteriaceae bacterium]